MRSLSLMVAAVALAALLALASDASAGGLTSLAKSTAFRAPYPGNTTTFTVISTSGDCGFKTHFSTSPGVNVTTGVYKGVANATARSCGPTEVGSQVELAPGIYPSEMVLSGIGGARSVKLFWTITYSYDLTASETTGAFANASISFYDLSAVEGDGVFFSNSPGVQLYSNSGTISGSETIHLVAFINLTFSKDQQYTIFPDFYAYADATATPGGAQAFAELNVGTHGNQVKLAKVVVT